MSDMSDEMCGKGCLFPLIIIIMLLLILLFDLMQ